MDENLKFVLEDETELELVSDVEDELELEDSFPSSDYHEIYQGPYSVRPVLYDAQEFSTRQKLMNSNMTVSEIPITETTNMHGGRTVVIG